MPSIKTALPTAVSAVLLLAGVSHAGKFAMFNYTPPAISNPTYRAGYYFQELDEAATGPDYAKACDIRRIWPSRNSVHGDKRPGVRFVPDDSGNPKIVEVNWGKGEGHWTYYDNYKGLGQHLILDLNGQDKGNCTPEPYPLVTIPCPDGSEFGTATPIMTCNTTYFHLPSGLKLASLDSNFEEPPNGSEKRDEDWSRMVDVLFNLLVGARITNGSFAVNGPNVTFSINTSDRGPINSSDRDPITIPYPIILPPPCTPSLPNEVNVLKNSALSVGDGDGVAIKIAA